LKGTKHHPLVAINEMSKKYGPVYTFWLGNNPTVFIHDLDLAKKAFNTSAFAGRPQIPFIKMFCNSRGTDVLFADYGKSWRCLRNITHSAVRKYATEDRFASVTCELVDDIVGLMLDREGVGQPFSPVNYIQLTLYNIICYSVFGKKYTFNDPEFLRLESITKTMFDFGNRGLIIQFIPISGLLFVPELRQMYKIFRQYKHYMIGQFKRHEKTYEEGLIRDFTDALIAARNEARSQGKESAAYLSNYSLICSLWDLLFAGVDTTQITVQWMLLLMCKYPDVQRKLRQEVEDVIGVREPQPRDINDCHYINAFISETLRFRPVLPFGVPHKTTQKIELDELTLPANTLVVVHQHHIMNDPKLWSKPEVFLPERFLSDNHQYLRVRPPAFIPFSIGQRRCLGEKLALNNLFLIIVRFIQSTSGYDISLPKDVSADDVDLEPNPDTAIQFQYPKPYKIVLNKV
ncbi:unnamed protein product, partial [Medioppia subpectinata]